MVTINEFNQRSAPGYGMDVDFGDRGRRARYYGPGGRFFTLWQVTPDTLWYYWWRYRRVVGFDVRTRRIIGSLGPKGFVPDLASAPDRFGLVSEYYYWLSSKILRTATAVYDVDVESRSAALVFSAPPGETIGGAVATGGRGQPPGQFAVATRQFIRLLSPTGQEIWKAPYEPAYPKYTAVRISFLADTNHFALWIEPSAEAKVAAGGTLPSRVFWINDSEPNSRSADLPALPQPAGPDIMGKLALGLAPPGLAFIIPLIDHDAWREIKRQGHGAAFISLVVVALVCAMAGWLLGWRYNLSPRARIGWAVFHLVAGIPGLLGFLSVQDWPARESCPSCKRLRVVNRNDCEHCGAGFAPPHKTGIEIFEPLAPAKVEA